MDRLDITYKYSYMSKVMDFDGILSDATRILDDIDYDTFIGRGLSGSIVVPQLARSLGKNWALARKPTDNSHSMLPVEGSLGRRCVFVDDFIATGETLKLTAQAIMQICGSRLYRDDQYVTWDTDIVGCFLYQEPEFKPLKYNKAMNDFQHCDRSSVTKGRTLQ